VLLLDKPTGMTSNSALQAPGVCSRRPRPGIPARSTRWRAVCCRLCFGEATKFSVDLLDADKTYEADLLFGVTTDTGDADGNRRRARPVDFSSSANSRPLWPAFRGPIRQIPPMYSALKRDGRPLYELARQGIEVEREARAVTIHELRRCGKMRR
jgi:tRNA pseudouridine55 synthase